MSAHSLQNAKQQFLSEGLKLFFPAAALHAIMTPLVWVTAFGLTFPFARDIPASQWHAHEMIFGTFGAALAGFLTSAIAEWTGTQPRRNRALLLLLGLWVPGRIAGLFGIDALSPLAGMTDFAFLALLFSYVVSAMLQRRSTRHASFAVWTALLAAAEIGIRLAWAAQDYDLAARLLEAALMVFMAFFALAIARINVAVLNLALDPSGATTPYRPHPGRQNLAAGMVFVYAFAALAFPQSSVPAYLALAAAAAFFDRQAEWFIGTPVLRTEVLALGAANAFAGIGFALLGLSGLGFDIPRLAGVHALSTGSLGLAVIAVFIIAGLRHTGRGLDLPPAAHAAAALMLIAAALRVLPELGVGTILLGWNYPLAAFAWSAAFAVWLAGYIPLFLNPVSGRHS